MQCNQPFCGFSNGQYFSQGGYNPPPVNHGLSPEIVGEGEVTSVTLPDGTVQFFFIPTIKWWAPLTTPTQPYATTVNSNPFNNYFGTNISAWFVRTIANPPAQFNPNINSFPRWEPPRPLYASESNLSPGLPIKFHNDKWTSTTHLHHFFPVNQCVRNYSGNITLPSKGCAAVQVDTPMTNQTVCHYEVCSKPCHCTTSTCHCKMPCHNELPKTRSAMSLVEIKTQDSIKECNLQHLNSNKKHKNNNVLKILPTNPNLKRIKLEKEDGTCKCGCGMSKTDLKTSNQLTQSQGKMQTEKDSCKHLHSTNKLVATTTDVGCGGDLIKTAEVQCCYGTKPEYWYPRTESGKKFFTGPSTTVNIDKNCCLCDNDEEE